MTKEVRYFIGLVLELVHLCIYQLSKVFRKLQSFAALKLWHEKLPRFLSSILISIHLSITESDYSITKRENQNLNLSKKKKVLKKQKKKKKKFKYIPFSLPLSRMHKIHSHHILQKHIGLCRQPPVEIVRDRRQLRPEPGMAEQVQPDHHHDHLERRRVHHEGAYQ